MSSIFMAFAASLLGPMSAVCGDSGGALAVFFFAADALLGSGIVFSFVATLLEIFASPLWFFLICPDGIVFSFVDALLELFPSPLWSFPICPD